MAGLNWRTLEAAELVRTPFDHIAIAQVLLPECAAAIPDEFPTIKSPGSFSMADAPPGPVLASLIDDLMSQRFRVRMTEIFEIDLEGKPAVVTLRGQCSAKDGRVHTDSRSKALSLLIYLNDGWSGGEGQLRLMNRESGFDSAPVEIPATLGSMVAFRRSDTSWHGHAPFVGQRRALQFNYLQTARASMVGEVRHRISAFAKQLVA
ncbi:2OG-Fe(II) oxygenase [Phenylobacterium sp.]|uniref:2OG-Fe(II) oxygenase n=1 Tax=Phenylobacterium sp. TaxID=1871053 RepID=UPI0011F86D37|nr:2OG-Fe(II) oxygenase [Phenylobacterium sp.]THD51089.1 MAG: 2OG-Fe(II) oxygenase [Phenylobacterium sp.]